MSNIFLGDISNSQFKVGSADCKVYLGDTKVYPEETPQTLQWVTFNNGDVIPTTLDIYGVRGISKNLLDTYGTLNPYVQFYPSKTYVEAYVYNSDGVYCRSFSELATATMEIIFSNGDCLDFINQGTTVSGTIQLYIYA